MIARAAMRLVQIDSGPQGHTERVSATIVAEFEEGLFQGNGLARGLRLDPSEPGRSCLRCTRTCDSAWQRPCLTSYYPAGGVAQPFRGAWFWL